MVASSHRISLPLCQILSVFSRAMDAPIGPSLSQWGLGNRNGTALIIACAGKASDRTVGGGCSHYEIKCRFSLGFGPNNQTAKIAKFAKKTKRCQEIDDQ